MSDILKNQEIVFPIKPTQDWPPSSCTHTSSLYHRKILQTLSNCNKEEREENIFLVNSWQEDVLKKEKWIRIIPSEHENSRKLIAYFRGSQLYDSDKYQVIEIMHFLRDYVEWWYSQLFNEFGVLYRFPEKESLPEFTRNSYLVSGEDFRAISSIFADTIHFSDWRPVNIPWTSPILGTTPYNRNWSSNRYIHLPIEYENKTSLQWYWKPLTKSEQRKIQHSLQPSCLMWVFSVALKTIQQTEKILIKRARTYHEK